MCPYLKQILTLLIFDYCVAMNCIISAGDIAVCERYKSRI